MISTPALEENKLVIRPLMHTDTDGIIEIDLKVSGRRRPVDYISLVTEDLGTRPNLSTVAEIDGKLVGFILARHFFIGEPVEEAGLIQIIGVDPDYWSCGIGTMLIRALEANCRSKGIKHIRTMVKHRNSQFQKFFRIMGYEAGQLIDYNKEIR